MSVYYGIIGLGFIGVFVIAIFIANYIETIYDEEEVRR